MNRDGFVQPVLVMDGVSKSFTSDGQVTQAVCDVSLRVKRGNLVLLLGPSGSGKTTILSLMAGFVRPTAGKVLMAGCDVQIYRAADLQKVRAASVGFVFQNFLLIDALTARENVMIVQEFCGTTRHDAWNKADLLLQKLVPFLKNNLVHLS